MNIIKFKLKKDYPCRNIGDIILFNKETKESIWEKDKKQLEFDIDIIEWFELYIDNENYREGIISSISFKNDIANILCDTRDGGYFTFYVDKNKLWEITSNCQLINNIYETGFIEKTIYINTDFINDNIELIAIKL